MSIAHYEITWDDGQTSDFEINVPRGLSPDRRQDMKKIDNLFWEELDAESTSLRDHVKYAALVDFEESKGAGERRRMPLEKLSDYDPDMEHEFYRIGYMDDLALVRRMDKIGSPQKMFNFYRALKKDGHSSLARLVAAKLKQMRYDTAGLPIGR